MNELAMSEKEFQKAVVDLAEMLGWRALHVYPLMGKQQRHRTPTTIAGWPDLFCWNTMRPERGLVAMELKVRPNKPTADQLCVLDELRQAGVRTMVAYPEDLEAIRALLYLPRFGTEILDQPETPKSEPDDPTGNI